MAIAAVGPEIWKIADGSDLIWKQWDDEYVVFQSSSGDTHLFNLLAGEALKSLETGPADVSQLAARVAAALEVEPDSELVRQMEQLLARLDRLGLIEPCQE